MIDKILGALLGFGVASAVSSKKYARGGRVKDVFEEMADHPKNFSSKLISLRDEMEEEFISDGLSYDKLGEYVNRFENLGYTFDYGLDAEPYALRKIGTPLEDVIGFNDEGFAKGGALFMPKGRELLYQDEDVALQHNTLSDHYSLINPKTGAYMAKGGEISDDTYRELWYSKDQSEKFQEQLEYYAGVVDVDYEEGREGLGDIDFRVFSHDQELLEKIKQNDFENEGRIEKYHGVDYVLKATKWFIED